MWTFDFAMGRMLGMMFWWQLMWINVNGKMMEKAEEASAGKKYPLSIEQPSRFAQKSIFFLLMLYTDINPIFFGSDEFNSLGSWVPIPELTLGIFGLPVGVYLPIRRSVNKPNILFYFIIFISHTFVVSSSPWRVGSWVWILFASHN